MKIFLFSLLALVAIPAAVLVSVVVGLIAPIVVLSGCAAALIETWRSL